MHLIATRSGRNRVPLEEGQDDLSEEEMGPCIKNVFSLDLSWVKTVPS